MSVARSLLQQTEPLAQTSAPDRRTLGDWVLRRLYEGIFSGEFQPGLLISETGLADRLQVSRQPIRDALRQIEADGLIEEAAGNGARRVVVFDLDNLIEIYTIRAALESVSFAAAAPQITEEQLIELDRIQTELEARLSEGQPAPGSYDHAPDFRFHEIVAEAAGMPQLHAFLVRIWLKTWALLNQLQLAGTYPNVGEIADSYLDRRHLLEALRAREGQRAADAVVEHVTHRKNQLVAAIESGRGQFRLPAAAANQGPRRTY